MSGVPSPAFARDLLRMYFHRGFVPAYTSVEVALTRRVPVANAGLNQLDEPVGGGYRRSGAVPLDSVSWTLTNAGEMTNAVGIAWPLDCTVPWGTIHGWALIAAGITSPPVLAIGEIPTPTPFVPPMRPHLPPGSVSIGLFER